MSGKLHPPVSTDDHTRGDAGARVELTVFGDYECPVSARLWRVVREMRASEAFLEVFRHFPLTGVHPHAFAAAQAAEAAGDQGMFWPMHDRLFEHHESLDVADLTAHATTLGLEIERFDEDLAYGSFADSVREHQRSGISSGVVTTPAVFVNGRLASLAEPEHLPSALAQHVRDAADDA
jgi:protein-disulfide isomerase